VTEPTPIRVALALATSTGGVGQHVRSLAEHLVKAGHHVVVFGPAATERLFGFTTVGAKFRAVEIAAGLDPLHDAGAVLALRGGTAGADVVHAHGFRAGFLAALARTGRSTKPLVVTWHNTVLATGLKGRVLNTLERRVARAADITLGASEDLVTRALSIGGRDVRLGEVAAPPLAAPVRDAAEIRRELGFGDSPLILSVGRLHPQKSFDVLIEAAARWSKRDKPPVVAIAGSGPQEAELVAQITRLDAPVRLLGRRSDIAELLNAADVAVVTSQWEARQLFAQEALRAGTPLVATAVGGLPGLLGEGAVLTPAGNVDALVDAVAGLLDDPASAATLVERGHLQAAQWPTEEQTASQVEAVYAELLGREPRA
jgi:glycosyltransferase involved in cell wall biosynthesis